jgi:hypothetical protein
VRREAPAAIAVAARAAAVQRLVQEPIAFVYDEGVEEWRDEAVPVAGGRDDDRADHRAQRGRALRPRHRRAALRAVIGPTGVRSLDRRGPAWRVPADAATAMTRRQQSRRR